MWSRKLSAYAVGSVCQLDFTRMLNRPNMSDRVDKVCELRKHLAGAHYGDELAIVEARLDEDGLDVIILTSLNQRSKVLSGVAKRACVDLI